MQLSHHTQSVHELSKWVQYLKITNCVLFALLVGALLGLLMENKIVLVQVPNGSGSSVQSIYEKNSLDRSSQKAIILSTVSAIAQINPSNYEYEKNFIQNFLAPDVYTAVSLQIDQQAKKMLDQRELGSYYFDFKEYLYDPALDKHFVKGDIHTVNAVKNSAQSWVFELGLRVDNYRPVITSLSTYPGSEFHNATWMDLHNRGKQ